MNKNFYFHRAQIFLLSFGTEVLHFFSLTCCEHFILSHCCKWIYFLSFIFLYSLLLAWRNAILFINILSWNPWTTCLALFCTFFRNCYIHVNSKHCLCILLNLWPFPLFGAAPGYTQARWACAFYFLPLSHLQQNTVTVSWRKQGSLYLTVLGREFSFSLVPCLLWVWDVLYQVENKVFLAW